MNAVDLIFLTCRAVAMQLVWWKYQACVLSVCGQEIVFDAQM